MGIITFDDLYNERQNKPPFDLHHNMRGFPYGPGRSDISAHMPFLQFIASQSKSVVELGVREGYSTVALLKGVGPTGIVYSYDIDESAFVKQLMNLSSWPQDIGTWKFKQTNTSNIESVGEVPEHDFLFVDTLHTYFHIKKEIEIFAPKTKSYIVFHDTYSQGEHSLDKPGEEGINRAIREFLLDNPSWQKMYEVSFNHGLTVLAKVC